MGRAVLLSALTLRVFPHALEVMDYGSPGIIIMHFSGVVLKL